MLFMYAENHRTCTVQDLRDNLNGANNEINLLFLLDRTETADEALAVITTFVEERRAGVEFLRKLGAQIR